MNDYLYRKNSFGNDEPLLYSVKQHDSSAGEKRELNKKQDYDPTCSETEGELYEL